MFPFSKSKRTSPGLTGIDLRDDGASVVSVVREPGRAPQVVACDFVEWHGAGEQAKALARIAAVRNLKHCRCTTVLSPDDYSLLLTEAPDVPADELRSAVRWRIKDLIDFHVDDATIDVFDVSAPNAVGKTRSMYVVAARNAAIQRRVDLCDEAGVGLDIIDIPEMAQRNIAAILPEDVRGVAVLTLSDAGGLITVTRQGEIFLSRRLEIGLDMLHAAPDPLPYFEQIVLEVQRSLDYYDSHFRQAPVDHVVLSPSAAGIAGLLDYLNENLNVTAAALDISQVLSVDPAFVDMLAEKGLVALGAALRQEEKAL